MIKRRKKETVERVSKSKKEKQNEKERDKIREIKRYWGRETEGKGEDEVMRKKKKRKVTFVVYLYLFNNIWEFFVSKIFYLFDYVYTCLVIFTNSCFFLWKIIFDNIQIVRELFIIKLINLVREHRVSENLSLSRIFYGQV